MYNVVCTLHKEAFDALSAFKSFSPDRIMVDFELAAVQMEQSSTDGKISAYIIEEQPPKKRKANNDKDRRILSIIENYIYGDDVLTYIDLLKSAM